MNQESGITEKLKAIKLLLMDFDGVLTDGFVYVNQDGVETVRCSRKDSLGIAMLKKAGIEVGVISKETNPVVAKRCEKLKIPYWQGIKDGQGKKEILLTVCKKVDTSLQLCAYIGDDIHDIPALEIAGVKITVSDAHPQVKQIADYITSAAGGNHAVREACEMILRAKGIRSSF